MWLFQRRGRLVGWSLHQFPPFDFRSPGFDRQDHWAVATIFCIAEACQGHQESTQSSSSRCLKNHEHRDVHKKMLYDYVIQLQLHDELLIVLDPQEQHKEPSGYPPRSYGAITSPEGKYYKTQQRDDRGQPEIASFTPCGWTWRKWIQSSLKIKDHAFCLWLNHRVNFKIMQYDLQFAIIRRCEFQQYYFTTVTI